jgi:uncharacterized membrane protein YoaK (UPF0700 family)
MAAPAIVRQELFPADLIVSLRRVVSLGIIAGYVDSLGFIDLKGTYTAAMTGNTVQFGVSFVQGNWTHLGFLAIVLGAFFCGAASGSFIRRRSQGAVAGLTIMAILLLAMQAIRLVIPGAMYVELPLLAFTMAMQGMTISRFGGYFIQTIVATGGLLQFADGVVGRLAGSASVAEVLIPGFLCAAYAVGAAFAVLGTAYFAAYAFCVPILLLALTAYDVRTAPSS